MSFSPVSKLDVRYVFCGYKAKQFLEECLELGSSLNIADATSFVL